MKKLLNVLFVMIFALTLVSCGGGNNGGSNSGSGDKIVVQFWHGNGQAIQNVIEEMITSFEKKYPNVDVQQTSESSYDNLLDKVKKFILGSEEGTLPAIVQTYPDHVTAYLHSNSVVDLNTYVYDEEVGFDAQGFDPSILVESFYNEGSVYGGDAFYSLPFNKSSEVVFYNQTIFAKYDWFTTVLGYNPEDVYSSYKAVEYNAQGYVSNAADRVIDQNFVWQPTWQDFEKIGAAFKTTPEYKSILDQKLQPATFGYDSQSNLFITLTQQLAALDENQAYGANGQEAYTRFGTTGNLVNGEFTFLNQDNPYARQAMEYYKSQVDAGNFTTSALLSSDFCSTAFTSQQIIITCGSTQGASYNDSEVFQVGVATYPQWEGTPEDKYQVIQQGTNLTLLEQVDKEVEKYAWLFMLHMISCENTLKLATNSAYFPVRTDAYESQKYQDHILGITRDSSGKPETDDDGNIVYSPSITAKASKVGWMQRNWFYTNVTFLGTDVSRAEIESLVDAVMLGTTIDKAFADAKHNLKAYLQPEQQ